MQSYYFLSGGNKGNLRKAPLKNGGSAGTRTQGHLIKSQMLYQLSYRPTEGLFIFQQWE